MTTCVKSDSKIGIYYFWFEILGVTSVVNSSSRQACVKLVNKVLLVRGWKKKMIKETWLQQEVQKV